MSRPLLRGQERYAGDELQFTGYDLGWARGDGRSSGNGSFEDIAYGEEYRYQDENDRYYYEEQRQVALRRHGDLLQSANEKLRKAKEKGKTSVSLSADEIEALQRSQTPPRQREVTPPKTPSKGRSSRSSSTASQTGKKSSKKASSSRLFSNPSPSASRSRTPKKSRKSVGSDQQPTAPAPPAFMIAGPDGVPVYAPAGFYPPSPEAVRPGSSRSRAGSRSASSSSRREVTPPVEPTYIAYHPDRFYGRSSELPEGLRIARNRSASNAQHGSDYYGTSSMSAAPGRRNVSGPAEVSYSKVPRMQARSPLATRQESASPAQKWPPRMDSRPGAASGPSTSSSSSSSSSGDDGEEGVRVEIMPEPQGNGYKIDRRPVGSDVKRRKGRK